MEEKANQLSERFLNYAAEVIKIVVKLRKTEVGRVVGGQLLRSGTSSGANYEEGCGAQSRADFVHKLQIVFKELRESLFWLKLIRKSDLLKDAGMEWLIKGNYSGLPFVPYMDQGNRVAVNHADTVGLVQKRAKSYEIADLLSSYD